MTAPQFDGYLEWEAIEVSPDLYEFVIAGYTWRWNDKENLTYQECMSPTTGQIIFRPVVQSNTVEEAVSYAMGFSDGVGANVVREDDHTNN